MNQKLKYVLLVCSLLVINSTFAQLWPWYYLQKPMRIHTDTSIMQLSVIDEELSFTPHTNRMYYWCYERHVHVNQGGYSYNLLHGEFRCYTRENKLIEKGQFRRGLKCGEWRTWNSQGQLLTISTYRKGNLHGRVECFVNGEYCHSIRYKQGKETESLLVKWKKHRNEQKAKKKENTKPEENTNHDNTTEETPQL